MPDATTPAPAVPAAAAPTPAVTAAAPEPDTDDVIVTSTPYVPPTEADAEYVAKGPIFINGVRAYNEDDPVTAAAVKKNNLQDFVKKA